MSGPEHLNPIRSALEGVCIAIAARSGRTEKSAGYALSLERGRSKRTRVLISAGDAPQHLVVGSSSLCDWRVAARGVRPRHFRMTYTRGRLRIEDQCEPESVYVDGLCVGGRLELPCAARIEFGEAVIAVRFIPRPRCLPTQSRPLDASEPSFP